MDYSQILPNMAYVWKEFYMLFINGVGQTLLFSLCAVIGGVIIGMLLTLIGRNKLAPLRWLVKIYVEIVRGTPMLLQLYIFYFFIPDLLSFLDISKFQAVSMALMLNSAAYISEIFRAGIDAVDKGQLEAARSLGMSEAQAMRTIILPQAIKNILPALGNEFIMLIKETSLASTFFAGELMTVYKTINGLTFLIVEPLLIIAIIYFVLTFSLSQGVKILERKMSNYD